MQIATPVHVPAPSETALPGEQQPKAAQAKALKNSKLGAFSKILEGLRIQNPKTEGLEGVPLKSAGKTAQVFPGTASKERVSKETQGKKISITGEPKNLQEAAPRSRRGKQIPEEGFAESILQSPGKKSPEKVSAGDARIASKEKKDAASPQKLEAQAKPAVQETLPAEKPAEPAQIPAQLIPEPEKPDLKKVKAKEPETAEVQPASRSIGTPETATVQQTPRNAEKDGKTLAEAKPKEKRRLNVEVRDFRAESAVPQGPGQAQSPQAVPEIQAAGSAPSADLSLDLSSGGKSREAAFREADFRPAQAFEDILARELHQNLNGDIVRQAQIILREHGEGTIRLALKPESLGNVKIQLEMTENKITGHIIVESDEALRAFEREIRSLEQAFKESGFAGASLDMSLAGGNRENGADSRRQEMRFFTEQIAAGLYDGTPETAGISDKAGSGLSLVNMLA
jgi:flagellar hook-length control protein FliK